MLNIWQVGAEAVVRHLAQRALDVVAKSGGAGAPSTEALCARGGVASSSGRSNGGGARYRTRGGAPSGRAGAGGAPDQATEAEALCAREPGEGSLQVEDQFPQDLLHAQQDQHTRRRHPCCGVHPKDMS
jgi:hypothetical protein